MTTPPPAWYPDPDRPGRLRYWDGHRWTDHVHPAPVATAAPAPPRVPIRTGVVRFARNHKALSVTVGAVSLVLFGAVLGQAAQADTAADVMVEASTTEGEGPVVTPAPSATPAPTPTATPTPTPTPTPAPPEPAPAVDTDEVLASAGEQTALAAVATLEVKGRAPKTGYDRDLFGSGWADVDRNGCDTRNDVLARDLTGETFKPGTNDCVVLTGALADPYSGRSIDFLRGNATSNHVQVDHVVALSDAWQKGAQQWSGDQRVRFANDPLNLLAVDGPLNAQKGDGDAATWLPPNKAYRCAYVARQVAVKVTYGAWVTAAEKDAMVGVLSGCPDEPLPGGVVVVEPEPAPEPEREPGPAVVAPAPEPDPPSVYFKNCSAARAAGAAPVRIGDPGYGTHLDRDRDGIGCE